MRGFRVSVIHRAMRGFPIIHLPFYFSQSLNDDSNYTPLSSKLTPYRIGQKETRARVANED